MASAKAQLDVRRSERSTVAARLIDPATVSAGPAGNCFIQLRAPVTGVLLKIIQDSEATVPSGAPLAEFGDPLDLEVIADLLSSDAVKINVGAPVRIDGWGGASLQGRVTRVDPAGFLKVSALGIEEQRVRVTIDFVDPPEAWSRLGHDFRVIVHVTVWSAAQTAMLALHPVLTLAYVFAEKDGRVRTAVIKIGHRNSRVAEVLSGLAEGERVVLHPGDRVRDGIRVSERES